MRDTASMLQFITDIQRTFLFGGDPKENFARLLDGLLRFTESEYGFIGEVNLPRKGERHLEIHAFTGRSWDKAISEFFDTNKDSGLEFHNSNTLIDYCVKTGEPVIVNAAPQDNPANSTPKEHPPLDCFLGLPLFHENILVGMVGVANRNGGYSKTILSEIEPLTATVSALVHSHKLAVKNCTLMNSQAAILNSTFEGICGVDNHGAIIFANKVAQDLLGRSEDEMRGKSFHDLICRWNVDGRPIKFEESALYSTLSSGITIEVSEGLFWTGKAIHLTVDYSTVAVTVEKQVTGAVITFKDITKRKFAEKQALVSRAKEEVAIQKQRKEMNRLAKLVVNSPLCIHEIALDGTLLSMNPSGLLMMGAADEAEIKGLQYMNIPCKGYQQKVRDLFAQALQGETSFFDFAADTEKGLAYFSSCFVPIEDDGSVTSVMGITEDITAHKDALAEIKRREKRLRAIMDSVPSMIFVKDENGRYLEANQAAADSMGLPVEEMLGKVSTTVHSKNPELAARASENDRYVFETGNDLIIEEPNFITASGDKKHVQVIKRLALEGVFDKPAVVANVVDITELKGTEKSLIEAIEKANEASKAKSDFLSSVSHELRTPLNSVMGHAQLMQFDELSDDHKLHTDQIIIAAKKLTQQIDALLFFGKAIHRAKGEKALIKFAIFFEALRLQLEPAMQEKGLRFHCDIPEDLSIWASDTDIAEVFTNLLANAVKYNRQGGSVTVSIARRSTERVAISVRDTGLGFSEKLGTKIFEPFERLDKRNSTIEGTGLGLSIAKEAADRLGATIDVHSAEDIGSEFIVDLKILEQEPPLTPGPPGVSSMKTV